VDLCTRCAGELEGKCCIIVICYWLTRCLVTLNDLLLSMLIDCGLIGEKCAPSTVLVYVQLPKDHTSVCGSEQLKDGESVI
jgi:hypothetical protein